MSRCLESRGTVKYEALLLVALTRSIAHVPKMLPMLVRFLIT